MESTRFRGRILAINGEDDVFRPFNERTVVTGPGGYEFPYGAMEWLANCVREREEMVVVGAVPIYFGDNQLLARWTESSSGTEGQSSGASTQWIMGGARLLAESVLRL